MSEKQDDEAAIFAAELVSEIRAEMSRQGIHSVRALSERMGKKNHTYLNDRFNGSPRGTRVPINSEDLWGICAVLGIEPGEMVRRAQAATNPSSARRGAG